MPIPGIIACGTGAAIYSTGKLEISTTCQGLVLFLFLCKKKML